jgi:hypothetical protein
MSETTRQGLRLLLGLWFLAGLVLLIEVLVKGDVDRLAARVGESALAVVLLSYAVLSGVRLAERQSWSGLFGALTVLISTSTFFLVAVGIWSSQPLTQLTRTVVMVVISLLMGTMSLLLDGDEDEGLVRIARNVACLALVGLGTLVVFSATGTDVSPRLSAFVSVLFVFPALALPALRLLDGEH